VGSNIQPFKESDVGQVLRKSLKVEKNNFKVEKNNLNIVVTPR
jgi:hypothetical protein